MSVSIYEIIIVFMYLLAINFGDEKSNNKKKQYIFTILFLIFFVQSLRRNTVGTDLFTYENQYYRMRGQLPTIVFAGPFEFGYQTLQYIFSNLGLPYQLWLSTISLFNLSSLYIVVNRYSPYPFISFMMYFFIGVFDFSFSGLRQSLAMSIILLSFYFIEKKEPIKFIITIIIASTFHITSLIFLIIYIITNMKFKKIYLYSYVLILIVIFVMRPVLSFALTYFFNRNYLYYQSYNGSLIGGTAIVILFSLLLGGITVFYDRSIKRNYIYEKTFIIISIAFVIQLLSSFSYLFTRFNLFYYQFSIIYIPIILEHIIKKFSQKYQVNKKYLELFIYTITFIFILVFYHFYLKDNPYSIMPYKFFWQ